MFGLLKIVNRFTAKTARKQFITITPAAMAKLKQIFSNRKNPNDVSVCISSKTGVKISLTKRGCNGLSYTMNYVEKPDKFDQVVEKEGMTIILDSKALMALVGTELDYVESDISSEFVFNNPNEKGRCGCGESFHL